MHRLVFPATFIFGLICLFVLCQSLYAQQKPSDEVDLARCWSYPIRVEGGVQMASDGRRIFIGSGDGTVEALSMDGKKIWSSEFGGEITSNILASGDGLFFVTSTRSSDNDESVDGTLRSVSKETGITNWIVKVPVADKYFLKDFSASVVLVSKNGMVQSVDTKLGEMKWKREIAERFVANPVFSDTEVLFAAENKIFTVSMATGEMGVMRKTAFDVTALAVTKNGGLISGDDRGNISSINGLDKPLWSFRTGGRVSNIFAVGSHVLAASHDNFVYFLKRSNGARVWKKRLMGRVEQIANINGQYTLLSGFGANGAVLIDLTSGRVAGQIVLGEDETVVVTPVVTLTSKVFLLTNASAFAFSLNGNAGCSN